MSFPAHRRPLGNYLAVSDAGPLIFWSGHVPIADGKIAFMGWVGAPATVEMAQQAAVLAALNILAHIRAYLIVRIEDQVSSVDGFHGQVEVMKLASNLFAAVLDNRAGHARTVFSVSQLPESETLMLVVVAEVDV